MSKFTLQDWTIFFMGVSSLMGAVVAGMLKVLAAIKEIHLSINSRMDQFLEEARKSSLAEGRDQMRQFVGRDSTEHVNPPPVVQVERIVAHEITAQHLTTPPKEQEQ